GRVRPDAIRDRRHAHSAEVANRKLLGVRGGEAVIECDFIFAECCIEMLGDSAEDAAFAAAAMANGGIGCGGADVMHQLAGRQQGGIAGVMADQPAVAVEGEADPLVAERVALVLPSKVLDRARRMREAAIEEIENLRLVARPEGANGEARVSEHAS